MTKEVFYYNISDAIYEREWLVKRTKTRLYIYINSYTPAGPIYDDRVICLTQSCFYFIFFNNKAMIQVLIGPIHFAVLFSPPYLVGIRVNPYFIYVNSVITVKLITFRLRKKQPFFS